MTPGNVAAVDGSLWVITSYFNPMGYQRRRANYRAFRRHLNLPLATIEWSPDSNFVLDDDEADLMVRVGGGSLMWQKERLLNLLLPQLPAQCRYVAWVDCDVVFERSDWGAAAIQTLQAWPLIQLYDTVRHAKQVELSKVDKIENWSEVGAEMARPGFVSATEQNEPLAQWAQSHTRATVLNGDPSIGFAWAARRALLERHPFLDIWVAGGGDAALCFAAFGIPERVVLRHGLSDAHRDHYLPLARALAQTVKGQVGHLPGTIHALWHGEIDQRGYQARHQFMARHGFDPSRFLQLAPSGVWQWTAAAGALAVDVRDYFVRRNEDGLLPPPGSIN